MLTEAQRLRFVDNSLDYFFEVYEKDGYSDAFRGMFEQFGIGDMFDYAFDRDTYRAVAVSDGQIDARSVIDDGKVPVAMLYPSETVDIMTGMHPLQTKPLETSVIKKQAVMNPGEHAGASLYTPVGVEELPDRRVIHRGGPLIAYNFYPEVKKQGRTCSSVVAHESTHLAQLLAHPPRHYPEQTDFAYGHARDVLIDELQAYAVQAQLWDRVVLKDQEPLSCIDIVTAVNVIRQRLQGDSFDFSKALIRALLAHDTARLILSPTLAGAA